MEDTAFAYSTIVLRKKKRKGDVGYKPPALIDLVDRAKADVESNGWMSSCLGWKQGLPSSSIFADRLTDVTRHYPRRPAGD